MLLKVLASIVESDFLNRAVLSLLLARKKMEEEGVRPVPCPAFGFRSAAHFLESRLLGNVRVYFILLHGYSLRLRYLILASI